MDAVTAATQQVYAAWVQAIGSIIAIGVAIYVPYRQRRHESRLRELEFWLGISDVNRRISAVAIELTTFVERLIEGSEPLPVATRVLVYPWVTHEEMLSRISVLESRDIGDAGLDGVDLMRNALIEISGRYPRNGHVSIKPGDMFSRDLDAADAVKRIREFRADSLNRLNVARAKVTSLSQSR